LAEKQKLPGAYAFDDVKTSAFHFKHQDLPYLDTVTWDVQINCYSSINHYTVVRKSRGGAWNLQKAWSTDKHDSTNTEYSVP